jgi:trans-2,3-dihydro-3-hydroxyanthranilate isomerase
MESLRYEIVDVFTDRPYAGNPLAVVFCDDPGAIDAGRMQTMAREFNLSETVFVLPPTTADATYRLRIFTPTAELPFAGHPSVGAAVTQMRLGRFAPGDVIQECGAGLLPVRVGEDGTATLTGGVATVSAPIDPGPLLDVIGLTDADFAGTPPRRCGCGLQFTYLPVRDDAVRRAVLDASGARAAGLGDVSVFAWDGEARVARTRVFVPEYGVPEDPATGSAALGLGVWLVASGLLPGDGESAYTVVQGVEMGRPSELYCTVTAAGGAVTAATVSGSVVPIARGEIVVPAPVRPEAPDAV